MENFSLSDSVKAMSSHAFYSKEWDGKYTISPETVLFSLLSKNSYR